MYIFQTIFNVKVKIYFHILVFVFLQGYILASSNFESDFPIYSTGSLKFDVDVCQYDGPGDSTYVEIYYSVFLSKNNSEQSQEDNITQLSIELQLVNEAGDLVGRITDKKSVSLFDSLNPSEYTTFYDLQKFKVLPANVVLIIKIQESQALTKGEISQSFEVRTFDNVFSISGLYFVSHIQRASEKNIFNKGGLMMVPNPSRIYYVSGDNPKMYVYYEINNLTFNKDNPSLYETNPVVTDVSGNEIFSNPKKELKVTSKNTSRIEVIPVKEFKSGVYNLTINVIDIASGLKQEIKGYFQVDRGDEKNTEILPMSEEEEKKYLDQIKYIASKTELEIFEQLDPRGKQEFILRFWKSKDPDKSTPENEFMLEHFRRLMFVENEFKGGMDSDMGRVYIMYGPPVDIERLSFHYASAQSVQIWVYAVDGRVDFVFEDRDGDGKFVLVHSTHRDEFSNPSWQEEIK